MNSVCLIGRLTRDPELRETQTTGTAVASFTLAVDSSYKNKDGNYDTSFFDCVAWKGTAEFVSKYFSKGLRVGVSGRLATREWTDKNDVKRRVYEIVADNVYFADGRREDSGGGYNTAPKSNGYGGAAAPSHKAPDVIANDFTEIDEDDGDLPF